MVALWKFCKITNITKYCIEDSTSRNKIINVNTKSITAILQKRCNLIKRYCISDLIETSLEITGDSMEEAQQRVPNYLELNYLRGFAILSVISIHVCMFFKKMININLLTVFYMTIDAFSHFAVPAFIFISGFGLYNSYNGNFQIGYIYRKRFKYILPPYFVFSTLYAINNQILGKMLHFVYQVF